MIHCMCTRRLHIPCFILLCTVYTRFLFCDFDMKDACHANRVGTCTLPCNIAPTGTIHGAVLKQSATTFIDNRKLQHGLPVDFLASVGNL